MRSLEQPLPPFVAAATNAPLLELLRWLQRYLVVADASAAGAPVVFASAGAAALLGARDVVGVPLERLLGREQLGGTLRGLGVAAPRGAKGGTAQYVEVLLPRGGAAAGAVPPAAEAVLFCAAPLRLAGRAAAGGGCKHVLGVLIEVGGATKRERNLGALAHDRLGTNGRRALLEVMRRLGGSFVLGDSRVDGNLLAVDAGAALGEAGGADADEVVGRSLFVRGASFLRGPRTDGALFDSLGESIARRDVVFASFVAPALRRPRPRRRLGRRARTSGRPPTARATACRRRQKGARICAAARPAALVRTRGGGRGAAR